MRLSLLSQTLKHSQFACLIGFTDLSSSLHSSLPSHKAPLILAPSPISFGYSTPSESITNHLNQISSTAFYGVVIPDTQFVSSYNHSRLLSLRTATAYCWTIGSDTEILLCVVLKLQHLDKVRYPVSTHFRIFQLPFPSALNKHQTRL